MKGGKPDWINQKSECFVQTLLCIVEQACRRGSKLRGYIIETNGFDSGLPMDTNDVGADLRSPVEHIRDWLSEQLPDGWHVYLWRMD
eukprot:23992-Pyramimonas_sp.AAC.1